MTSDVFGGNQAQEGREADVAFIGQSLQGVLQVGGHAELDIDFPVCCLLVVMGHCWVKAGLYL
jgi:hypothetical protein